MRKRGGEAMRKAAELPFHVDRNLRTNLVDQVVDGFHQAIRSGIYRSGDTIPTVRALAPQLGVSVRVTAEAVKALAAKGLVAPRPPGACERWIRLHADGCSGEVLRRT